MRASDIMTRQVITIDADSTVADAAKLMLESHISGMPVIDAQGRVVGIISGRSSAPVRDEHDQRCWRAAPDLVASPLRWTVRNSVRGKG